MKIPVILISLVLTSFIPLSAQHDVDLFGYWKYYSDAQNAMYKTSCALAFQQLQQREHQMAKLNSKEDLQQRQIEVREKLTRVLGPLPEKTPLHAQITGVIKKDDYRVEKILFESVPGYYVTAALFLPVPRKGKLPVVIYASGHTASGFRSEVYQHVIINLVKKGFAVFAFDPIGQGERWQYFGEDGDHRFRSSTIEHSYPGAQCYISGRSPTNYFVWDGIRSVDYLLTRKEIDPNRIGMTGRSGGGTQTAYTAAVDDRILAAAPECFITKMEYILKSIGPQDAEQNLYRMIAEGLDHADLLEVRAPKPTLMVTTTRDFFSIQGARETFGEVQQFYSGLEAGENMLMAEDDAEHTSTKKNREAMYAFFQKYLDNPGNSQDMEVEVFQEKELWVTEHGSVASIQPSESMYSLNKKAVRQQVHDLIDLRSQRFEPAALRSAIEQFSGFDYPEQFGQAIFSGRYQEEHYQFAKYLVPGGGDYHLPVGVFTPSQVSNGALVVLLDEQGMEHAASGEALVLALVKEGYSVMVADLPGLGSLGPGYLKGDAYVDNTSFNQWFAGILTGKSVVAMRAEDIVRITSFVQSELPSINSVYAISSGAVASELLHATVFETDIKKIALLSPFLSYAELALVPDYKPSFITSVVAGAIKAYDLPDLMAMVNPRSLLVTNPVDPLGEDYANSEWVELLKFPSGIHEDFTVVGNLSQDQLIDQIISWLNKK